MADESTQYARALARRVKAALMHLRHAEDLAELAGIDTDASEHEVAAAGLIRAAREAAEDLDMWAADNARASGAVSAETFTHTERWCHAEGGSLPAGSWPPPPAAAWAKAADSEGLRQLSAHLDQAEGREAARAARWSELENLRQRREAWEATARTCVCPPGLCSRRDGASAGHQGDPDPSGCMVCAELDPGQPCYSAVLRGLAARGARSERQRARYRGPGP